MFIEFMCLKLVEREKEFVVLKMCISGAKMDEDISVHSVSVSCKISKISGKIHRTWSVWWSVEFLRIIHEAFDRKLAPQG